MKFECLILVGVLLNHAVGPPVTTKHPGPDAPKERVGDDDFGLEYERYLKEIVSVLESDETFRKKLEESNVTDIKSGEIARHLEFVSHGIRTKLDEIKRKEIDRLRQALKLQNQMHRELSERGHDMKNMPRFEKNRILGHLDHQNPNSFEVDDLSKLIQQATSDLETIDLQRRQEFKRYEMEKELDNQQTLNKLNDEERQTEVKKMAEIKRKHADHPKLHHPGAKEQLEEVWEESDGLAKEDFNPKTFFALHDVNTDGVLDEEEVEALFQQELDKVYNTDNPEEDDPMERFEEMNRMREHVFNEVDKDQNKLISLEEFLDSTKGDQYEKDDGWETLEEKKVYTDEELEMFVKEYETRQQQAYEQQGHVAPVDPSALPPHAPLGQLHDQAQGVVRMEQDAGQERHDQEVVQQQEIDVPVQLEQQEHVDGQPQEQFDGQPHKQVEGPPQEAIGDQPQHIEVNLNDPSIHQKIILKDIEDLHGDP